MDLLDRNSFDKKYLFNSGVISKLEELFGREVVQELYSKLIPKLNRKKIKVIEKNTIEYFISNCVIHKEGERLITSHLYDFYLKFCRENLISPYGKVKFFKKFRELKKTPKINDLSVTLYEGKRYRYFADFEVVV